MRDTHDYIVVGSGSGGAAVTRRLVDAGAQVLLIEAGARAEEAAVLRDPTRWVEIAGSEHDWGYVYEPSPAVLDRRIALPRGRVLGGSSAINAMMWYRGHPSDYEAWVTAGCPGWSFAECLPAFRRAEDWQDGATALRGAGGPLRIERPADPHPFALALIEAAAQMGLPVLEDPNGPSSEGAALANLNLAAGRRFCSARGYLHPILHAPNLTLATHTRALRVVIEGERAVGVEHARQDRSGRCATLALSRTREAVILAAGAIETPRLLVLSGIGPEPELRRLGLPVRCPAAVGENLQDHPLVRACNFVARRPPEPLRDNGGGAILNWRSGAHQPRPDLHAVPVQRRSATPEVERHHALRGDHVAIAPGLMGSLSRGRLRVLSAEPDGPLSIAPNFLAHPADLAALVEGVRFVLELARQPALRGFAGACVAPGPRPDRAALEDFVRRATSTFYHACGTCRMGEDDEAVVDPRLRVRGVRGLRIADASVIPVIPACNTHAPVTMIGERAADFLLEAA